MARLELQGVLRHWDQEGGYASPVIQIGNEDLTTRVAELIAEDTGRSPDKLNGAVATGVWRITIERIE